VAFSGLILIIEANGVVVSENFDLVLIWGWWHKESVPSYIGIILIWNILLCLYTKICPWAFRL